MQAPTAELREACIIDSGDGIDSRSLLFVPVAMFPSPMPCSVLRYDFV